MRVLWRDGVILRVYLMDLKSSSLVDIIQRRYDSQMSGYSTLLRWNGSSLTRLKARGSSPMVATRSLALGQVCYLPCVSCEELILGLPAPRGGHSATFIGRSMFVFGGYGGHGFFPEFN